MSYEATHVVKQSRVREYRGQIVIVSSAHIEDVWAEFGQGMYLIEHVSNWDATGESQMPQSSSASSSTLVLMDQRSASPVGDQRSAIGKALGRGISIAKQLAMSVSQVLQQFSSANASVAMYIQDGIT